MRVFKAGIWRLLYKQQSRGRSMRQREENKENDTHMLLLHRGAWRAAACAIIRGFIVGLAWAYGVLLWTCAFLYGGWGTWLVAIRKALVELLLSTLFYPCPEVN